MSEILYPSLRETPPVQHHPDGLDKQLKEINSFYNSIQKFL